MAMTDEALALIGAAFIAGVKAQAVVEAKAVGKKLVKKGTISAKKKTKKTVSAYHKHLGVVMRKLKKRHTKKNGDFKMGWDMKRIMAVAHKETKRSRGKK